MLTGSSIEEPKLSKLVALEHVYDTIVEEARTVLLYATGDRIRESDVAAVKDAGWGVAEIADDDVNALRVAINAHGSEAVSHKATPEVAGFTRADESAEEVAELRAKLAEREGGKLGHLDPAAVAEVVEGKDARIAELEAALAAASTGEPPADPEPVKEDEPVKPETKDKRGPKDPEKK